MKTFKYGLVFSLFWLTYGSGTAQAGWNNVFQTTCNCNQPQQRSSYFAPETSCQKVEYVQRSYYTPVTVWKREVYEEPVTVKYRSFYWEPVESMTYTSYYDPCTGCSQRVAVPRTSYRLRSQENCAQKYVQRSRLVPVTEMRVSYYMEPVITRYTPPPSPCDSCGRAPTISEGTNGARLGSPSDGAPARMPEDRISPPNIPQSGYRAPAPATTPIQNNTPPLRLDRFSSNSRSGEVQGVLVAEDRFTPRANTRVTLVNKTNPSEQKVVNTDSMGRFNTNVPSGEWSIYVPTSTGKAEYHSTLAVRDNDLRNVTIVSW
jgi:hypothetical protein